MSSSVPVLEPPLKMSSTTNSKNHNKNKYNEQTTSLGDNVVTYCPNEDLSKQCAFAFEMDPTIFHVVNVANIPDIVTQIFNNKTNPMQNVLMPLPSWLFLLSMTESWLRKLTNSGDELKNTDISVANSNDSSTIRDEYWDEM